MRIFIRIIALFAVFAGGLLIFFHYTGPTYTVQRIKGSVSPMMLEIATTCTKHPEKCEKMKVPSKGIGGIIWGEWKYLHYGAITVAAGLFLFIVTYIVPKAEKKQQAGYRAGRKPEPTESAPQDETPKQDSREIKDININEDWPDRND